MFQRAVEVGGITNDGRFWNWDAYLAGQSCQGALVMRPLNRFEIRKRKCRQLVELRSSLREERKRDVVGRDQDGMPSSADLVADRAHKCLRASGRRWNANGSLTISRSSGETTAGIIGNRHPNSLPTQATRYGKGTPEVSWSNQCAHALTFGVRNNHE